MEQEYKTSDIYEAAYYVVEGLTLARVEIRDEDPDECVFVVKGSPFQVGSLTAAYGTGRASSNVLGLKRQHFVLCKKVRQARRAYKQGVKS